MIRLHTGVPGAGKTLDAVYRAHFDSNYKNRPIYHHGIEGLDSGIRVYCHNPDCRTCKKATKPREPLYIEDWYDYCEPTAVFIVDEAHRPFPMRASKEQLGKTPPGVANLTESRHEGVDFIMITQNAMFLDIGIRRLVELHVHYSKGLFLRVTYTHNEVMANDQALKFGEKSVFFIWPRRKAFNLYKSAEVHTVIKGKVPWKIWALLGLCLTLAVLGYSIFQGFNSMRERALYGEAGRQEAPTPDKPSGVREEAALASAAASSPSDSFQSDLYDFEPRLYQYPETAPAFDDARPPVQSVPVLKACIHKRSDNLCQCYDQQGVIYPTSLTRCLNFIRNREHDRYPAYGSSQVGASQNSQGIKEL